MDRGGAVTAPARAALIALAAACALACGDEPAPGAPADSPEPPSASAPESPPRESAPRAWPASGAWSLAFAQGAVSVDAFEAPRRPLLEELAKRAGFALEAAPGAWPPLTLRIEAQPLELALPLLVGELEYRAEWASDAGAHRLTRLVVGGARGAQPSADAPSLRPGEVGDSLQRALAELADEEEPLDEADALRGLEAADPETRMRAVLALEPEGEGLTALIGAIERDPDPRVRAAATVGLEESDEFAAVQALVGALADANPEVVVEAIDSLEFAGDASVVASLEPLLGHSDPRVRKSAADAIRLLAE
ncbi:MAG TPA: HEAT repeat domain-containing protein [Myxococcota bacterium]|nr:HEAT repeat domain-containing protein [Myxococcota bacterium]